MTEHGEKFVALIRLIRGDSVFRQFAVVRVITIRGGELPLSAYHLRVLDQHRVHVTGTDVPVRAHRTRDRDGVAR